MKIFTWMWYLLGAIVGVHHTYLVVFNGSKLDIEYITLGMLAIALGNLNEILYERMK